WPTILTHTLMPTPNMGKNHSGGFLLAAVYAAFVALTAYGKLPAVLVPRFNDIFLLGVIVAAYRHTWRLSALLAAAGAAVAMLRAELRDGLSILLTTSVLSIAIVTRLRSTQSKSRSVPPSAHTPKLNRVA